MYSYIIFFKTIRQLNHGRLSGGELIGASADDRMHTRPKKAWEEMILGCVIPKSINGGGTGHGRYSIGGKGLCEEATTPLLDAGGVTASCSWSGVDDSDVWVPGGG